MANKSISQLTAGGAVAGTDLFPDVQTAGVGPVKVTASQLATYFWNSPTLVTPNIGAATGTSLSVTANISGAQIYSTPTALTSSASITWNANTSSVASLTLNDVGATLNMTNLVAGGTYLLIITQGTGGNKTITTWTSTGSVAWKWAGGSPPTLSSAAGAIDIITAYTDGTTVYASAQYGFA